MKNLSKIIICVASFAMVLSSCSKLSDFGDTNENPNGTTVPTTGALLTNVLSGMGARASQQNPGYFCQYFSETQYPGASLYSNPQFDADGVYSGSLYDLQNIILQCKDSVNLIKASLSGNVTNQICIARILQSYLFWVTTDAWGDVPYKQALNANPFNLTFENRFPKFDTQDTIYANLFRTLETVVDQFKLDVRTDEAIKGDIIYKGDLSKWRKFANTLRVLMAVRLTKKFPNPSEYAAVELNKALSHEAGIIGSNLDNFDIVYPGASYKNPWFGVYQNRNDIGESKTFVDLLTGLSDPRQSELIFGSSNNGVPFGRDRQSFMNAWFAANSPSYARILNPNKREETSKISIVHAASVLFALAEAKARGWITSNPSSTNPYYSTATVQSLYNAGIQASFNQWGVQTSLTVYLGSPGVAINSATALNQIALQRYIATYPDGLQGWCEWRRTNVPNLTPALDAINVTKEIPRRYVYGVNDYTTNRANVLEAAARIPQPPFARPGVSTVQGQAGDTQDGRVWWDR